MTRVELKVEETTLSVLNNFMKERNQMQKAIDDDPHSLKQGNPVQVARALDFKADRSQIERLDEIKVNRDEVNVFDKKIACLQKEITHLIVLLNETINLNLTKAGEAPQAKENRIYELIASAQALSSISTRRQAAA